MESLKTAEENKTKSLFALDSDEESHAEGDSGLAGSIETSPTQNEKEIGVGIDELSNDLDILEKVDLDQAIKEDSNNSHNDRLSKDNQAKLSAFQRARVERNRQKALLLRQARLQAHPYRK